MVRNAYVDLCLQVQALRRAFEAVRTPLAPATGVGASLYTHQLANVHRVLTDVRVRHLLADEVGLGKTVQALMILNTLRYYRPKLQALIIVPDRLVPQWRDELMTRGHTAPFEERDRCEDGQYVRLAWEAQLRDKRDDGTPCFALSDIDPDAYDVLIVDEIHRLRTDLQDRIVRAAAGFEHTLILTATPAFQKPARHAQLFALLEPERAALARVRIANSDRGLSANLNPNDDLSKWPDWAVDGVIANFLELDRVNAESMTATEQTATALAYCAYRRVIRTRRVDYSGVLPRRDHKPITVEPLGAEAQRQALMWRYFDYLDDLSRRFDPILLAKRVVLSPPSLEQRVDFFRRKGHEREGLLERVKPLVHRSQGDSRADALVDLLAEVWAQDPTERVLVAAQDNLTVDYLFDLVRARLPLIGPLEQRVPLVAARVRQGMMTAAVDDLSGFGNETNENLEAFQRGEAQILFAPEAAQVGLNLQCARVLVLYSVPWRPEEVEQWIGRLDRIGNVAAFSHEGGAKTVDVYTIAQRGLVDERVVNVLKRFRVFERSVNLDGDHLQEVADLIEGAALRSDHTSWRELEAKTQEMAAADEVQELQSELRRLLPWSVESATIVRKRLETMPPAPCALRSSDWLGPSSWERAFGRVIKLLDRAGEYDLRRHRDSETGDRFMTLWYCYGERRMYGRRYPVARVLFSCDDPVHNRSPENAHAFIDRRSKIGSPPRRHVMMSLDGGLVRRPLRFLNFGDTVHDELVEGWQPESNGLQSVRVTFFDDHELWQHGEPSDYLVRATVMDPGAALLRHDVVAGALHRASLAVERVSPERIPELLRPLEKLARCALEADLRWIRDQLTAEMTVVVRKQTPRGWETVSAEEATALLNPMAHSREGLPMSKEQALPERTRGGVCAELDRQRGGDDQAAGTAWSHRFPAFEAALVERLAVVRQEGDDAVALMVTAHEQASARLDDARLRGNRAQITRAENELDYAADELAAARAFSRERSRWLWSCEERVRAVLPEERLTALIRARRPR